MQFNYKYGRRYLTVSQQLINVETIFIQGQVIDAIATPVFGFLIDRYCKKKFWHVCGSVMVTLSFPVIFGDFAHSSATMAMCLYITSITIFQTGWAAVQISHLSMIPSLTNSLLARADLTAIRYVNCNKVLFLSPSLFELHQDINLIIDTPSKLVQPW